MGRIRRNIFLGTGGSVLIFVICVGLTWTLSAAAPTNASETPVLENTAVKVQDVAESNGVTPAEHESSSLAPPTSTTSTTLSSSSTTSSYSGRDGRRRFILRGTKTAGSSSTPSPVYTQLNRARKRQANIIDPHFQPLDAALPKDAVAPFLEFGQKLHVATSSINSIAEVKEPTTLTPVKSSGPIRLNIHIEKSTSPNSIVTQNVEPSSTTSSTTSQAPSTSTTTTTTTTPVPSSSTTTTTTTPVPSTTTTSTTAAPSSTTSAPSVTPSSVTSDEVVTVLSLSTNSVSRHTYSAKVSSSSRVPSTTPSTTTVAPTTEKTESSQSSISDETYNDIMSIRRRRKKLVARRMQFNSTTASEVLTDGSASANETAMNAALVRRKTLLQPQRNSTVPQSVVRRPLLRITMPPLAKYTVDNATQLPSENQTEVIRNLLSTYHPSTSTNYTTSTRAITLEDLANGTSVIVQNMTVADSTPSSTTIVTFTNRTETPVVQSTTSTQSTLKASTTLSPISEVPPVVIKVETTTRRAWRPSSTTRRPSSSEVPSTSSPRTSTTRTTTSTLRSSTPVFADVKPMASETTFSSSRPASTDYTVKPFLGASAKKPSQPIKEDDDATGSSISVVTYALLSLAFVTAIGVASYGARHWANSRRRMLDESDSSCSEASSMAGATLKRPVPNSDEVGILPRIHQGWPSEKNSVQMPPQLPEWHFPRQKLRLQTVLGQGNFGQVWKAEAEDICGITGTRLVAVKSTKASAGEREKSDLLRELAIMQQLGSHPNVVTLLGCCTEQEPHYLIMEYVMYGKLLTFLRDHRTRRDILHFSSSDDDGGEQALTSWDLTHFAYCIAKGMEYLISRGIIHRDLAARNILVDHNKQCKIADFGMSRHARDSSGQVYEPRQKGALPIRWMSPESLVKSVFTHRSDVWSFGITMWEIVTLGSTPYSTMGAREVMRRVREGYRLERPQHCRPELFRVVSSCWLADPYHRPDFPQLRAELRRLRDEGAEFSGGGHVDLTSAIPPPSPASTLPPNTAGPHPHDPI